MLPPSSVAALESEISCHRRFNPNFRLIDADLGSRSVYCLYSRLYHTHLYITVYTHAYIILFILIWMSWLIFIVIHFAPHLKVRVSFGIPCCVFVTTALVAPSASQNYTQSLRSHSSTPTWSEYTFLWLLLCFSFHFRLQLVLASFDRSPYLTVCTTNQHNPVPICFYLFF